MDYKEYREQFLTGKSGQELAFQIANDIFSENGIPAFQMPVFCGIIDSNMAGKQRVKYIRSIKYKDILLIIENN